MLIKRLSKLCHTVVAKMLHRYSTILEQAGNPTLTLGVRHTCYAAHMNRLTTFGAIDFPKGVRNKFNRDWLNWSAHIEIKKPANNFGHCSEIVFFDPDYIPDANVVSEFFLQPYSDCTIGSTSPYTSVNVLLRDLYFFAHGGNSLRVVSKPGGFLAA